MKWQIILIVMWLDSLFKSVYPNSNSFNGVTNRKSVNGFVCDVLIGCYLNRLITHWNGDFYEWKLYHNIKWFDDYENKIY